LKKRKDRTEVVEPRGNSAIGDIKPKKLQSQRHRLWGKKRKRVKRKRTLREKEDDKNKWTSTKGEKKKTRAGTTSENEERNLISGNMTGGT